MKRKIIHIDADCFYAAVEVRDNPALKGQPIAVGGDADRVHGEWMAIYVASNDLS